MKRALCARQKHRGDCRAARPTAARLAEEVERTPLIVALPTLYSYSTPSPRVRRLRCQIENNSHEQGR